MNQSLYLQQDVLKRSLFRLPASLLLRAATFILIGLIVELSISTELVVSGSASLVALPLLALMMLLQLCAFLYLLFRLPQREILQFPQRRHWPLLVLAGGGYAVALTLVRVTASLDLDHNLMAFLLPVCACFCGGLPRHQAFTLMGLASALFLYLMAGILPLGFMLAMLSRQVLMWLLFDALIDEARRATTSALQLEELRTTQGLLKDTVERETRMNLARDLHDELGHLSTVISHNLSQYCFTHPEADPLLKNPLDVSHRLAQQVRAVSHAWQESEFDLGESLRHLVSLVASPQIHIDTEGNLRALNAVMSQHLYRCCQELITNSLRHSSAREIFILIIVSGRSVSLSYEENTPVKDRQKFARFHAGNGLRSLQERIRNLHGQTKLLSRDTRLARTSA